MIERFAKLRPALAGNGALAMLSSDVRVGDAMLSSEFYGDRNAEVWIVTEIRKTRAGYLRLTGRNVITGEERKDSTKPDWYVPVLPRDYCDEDGSQMKCSDCGRPTFYDYVTEDYRHVSEPERGCFLIPAEVA